MLTPKVSVWEWDINEVVNDPTNPVSIWKWGQQFTLTGGPPWYEEYLSVNFRHEEPIAKDPVDFQPMFEFYFNKFMNDNIDRMVVYAPRQSGKSYFLQKKLIDNPNFRMGCRDHRACRYTFDMINGNYPPIKERIFNASNDEYNSDWGMFDENIIYLIDEYLPHMRSIFNKRCFILITPNWNKPQYAKNDVVIVDMLRDYPNDLEESRRYKFQLPEELFSVEF